MPSEKPKLSPSGQMIYQHKSSEHKRFSLTENNNVYYDDIEKYLIKTFGERTTRVFHELISDFIHIDVFTLHPTKKDNRYILFTSGMSALPMTLPPECKPEHQYLGRAELVLYLPGNWEIENNDEMWYWPIRLIKMLARLPHEYKTWLGYGHSIPNGSNSARFSHNTKLCGSVLYGFEKGDGFITASDGTQINIYTVFPVYKQEMNYKLRNDANKLLDKLQDSGITSTIDIKRKNVCSLF